MGSRLSPKSPAGSVEMIFSIKRNCVGFLSSTLLLTALAVCFLYERYENFSLKRALETEKLELEKINLEISDEKTVDETQVLCGNII